MLPTGPVFSPQIKSVKTTPFICLLGLLLLGACSSIERGVVTAKGHRVDAIVSPPIDYYWVEVRGKNRAGEEKTERVQLFKKDWDRFKKGDRISPHDFDMIGATKAIGVSVKKFARIKDEPMPKPATPKAAKPKPATPKIATPKPAKTPKKSAPLATPELAPKPVIATPKPKTETETARTARFHNAEARAHDDAAVREMKLKIHAARTNDEQAAAFQAYRRALFQKMRELEPSLKDRIDAAETQR